MVANILLFLFAVFLVNRKQKLKISCLVKVEALQELISITHSIWG